MGMFNTIIADLTCPVKNKTARSEIQIKWQVPEQRQLAVYYEGEALDGLESQYENAWVRTDYICDVCSKKTKARNGVEFIKTMDQSRHPVFVRIERGRILGILNEAEFKETGKNAFVDDL